jgi:Reverse transcriptase (RNA-dependent DNA polymerase)
MERRGEIDDIDRLYGQLQTIPSRDEFDPNYRRLGYVRYADDFLLGFDGPKEEAEEIKARLGRYLSEQLKLELSPEKTLITHAKTEKARFLGYEISTLKKPGLPSHGNIALRIPYQVIEDKIARYTLKGRPITLASNMIKNHVPAAY